MSKICTNAWRNVAFITLVIGLILKDYKLIGFVIRTVVGRIAH